MNPFSAVLQITVCFFSVIGLYFFVTHITDGVVKRNAPSESLVLIEYCNPDDLEYLVRYYESRIVGGDFQGLVNGIAIARTVSADEEVLDRLMTEYENIKRI